jgi:adenylate cyclase
MALSARDDWLAWGSESSQEAIRRALENCGYKTGSPCIIVAVDENFVVPIPTTMRVIDLFQASRNPMISPEWRNSLAQRLDNAPNAWNSVAVGTDGRPGLTLNAPNEQEAIQAALIDCGKHDRNCHVISLGPFSVQPDDFSR